MENREKNKKIILASNNQNKLREMKNMLKEFNIEIISQKEAGYNIEVEETGTNFIENAILKAEAIYNLSKMPVLSDDSGLEIDALNGEPGVYSARYAGENATDQDKINKVLNKMEKIKNDKERVARFKCAICFIDDSGEKHIFEQACEGIIAKEPQGSNGFGYDPIFLVNNKSFAEMTKKEKAKVSHRGKAMREFLEYIRNI